MSENRIMRQVSTPHPHLLYDFCRNFWKRILKNLVGVFEAAIKPGHPSAWSTWSSAVPSQHVAGVHGTSLAPLPGGSAVPWVYACHPGPACTAVTHCTAAWQVWLESACSQPTSLGPSLSPEAVRVGGRKHWILSWNSTRDTFASELCWALLACKQPKLLGKCGLCGKWQP